jgi:hypothetical protein
MCCGQERMTPAHQVPPVTPASWPAAPRPQPRNDFLLAHRVRSSGLEPWCLPDPVLDLECPVARGGGRTFSFGGRLRGWLMGGLAGGSVGAWRVAPWVPGGWLCGWHLENPQDLQNRTHAISMCCGKKQMTPALQVPPVTPAPWPAAPRPRLRNDFLLAHQGRSSGLTPWCLPDPVLDLECPVARGGGRTFSFGGRLRGWLMGGLAGGSVGARRVALWVAPRKSPGPTEPNPRDFNVLRQEADDPGPPGATRHTRLVASGTTTPTSERLLARASGEEVRPRTPVPAWSCP